MTNYNTLKPDFSKGLLTVVLQHHTNKEVRMVGYMNEAAFEKTKAEGLVWFYSRSKERLWKKGESSGNYQYVKDMHLDCDNDALLIFVDPVGPTCHTGTDSCFNLPSSFSLKDIEATVESRAKTGDKDSYTRYLLGKGIDKITKKFGEEAFEVVIGAKNQDKEEIIDETADLLFHLGVLLYDSGVSVSEVEAKLADRHQKNNNFKGERKEIDKW